MSTSLKSIPGSSVTGRVLWTAARARVARWDHKSKSPEQIQHKTLLDYCQRAANTEFGRAHGLDRVRSYDDFKARVPVRSYAEFEPYLERMRRGETDVLWPGLIPFFGQSSGTSSTAAKNKFLPISLEQIRWQQKAAFDVLARYLAMTGDMSFTKGFTIALMPPATLKKEGRVEIGSNPGIMLRHVPQVSKMMWLPRPAVRDIEDYNKKLTAIAEAYLDYDVRALSGTTCWFSILFDRVLQAAKKRGRHVETIGEIWPNLRALFGGGVYADPYRRVIDERVGHPTVLVDNYNATEGGIFAISDRLGDPGMLMVPDRGVFFEFIPREQCGRPDAQRFALWQVEAGAEYAVAVTTCSGLFGYTMGDFVKVLSVFPHRIAFVGRASGMLSVTQELMTGLELERAVSTASASCSATVLEFAAGAEVGVAESGRGRYVLFAEFDRAPHNLDHFRDAFDGELCNQNRVYREHRAKDVAILAPEVVLLPPGTTERFMQKIGHQNFQQKFPRIVDDQRRDLLRALARAESVV